MNTKFILCALVFVSIISSQQTDRFHAGTVIPDYGKVATVESDLKIDAETKLKLRFDVAEKSDSDSINRTFDSAARFINLNVESGANPSNVKVAIVVHGQAAIDVTKSRFYSSKSEGGDNPNVKVVYELQKNGTSIYICGQTAAWLGIEKADLLPKVKLAPSAMTAHAILDQEGFALCPF